MVTNDVEENEAGRGGRDSGGETLLTQKALGVRAWSRTASSGGGGKGNSEM